MAIRLSRQPAAVLYNNRAAAYAGMGYWGKSLDDAGGHVVSVVIASLARCVAVLYAMPHIMMS
jgi:hypothetical protein